MKIDWHENGNIETAERQKKLKCCNEQIRMFSAVHYDEIMNFDVGNQKLIYFRRKFADGSFHP